MAELLLLLIAVACILIGLYRSWPTLRPSRRLIYQPWKRRRTEPIRLVMQEDLSYVVDSTGYTIDDGNECDTAG